MDNCDVFISCLDSHSDGTHSLQRIHWWANDVMLFLQIWWRNKLIYILDGWGWVHFQQIFIFGWTISSTTWQRIKITLWVTTRNQQNTWPYLCPLICFTFPSLPSWAWSGLELISESSRSAHHVQNEDQHKWSVMSNALMSRKWQPDCVDSGSQENLAVIFYVSLQDRFLTAAVQCRTGLMKSQHNYVENFSW